MRPGVFSKGECPQHVRNAYLRTRSDTRWGYLSVDASARYIYALYSGKLQKDGTAFNLGNEVRVFDWDGRPVCLLRLNAEGSALSVCDDRLFLLSESVETGRNDVVEYVLPDRITGKGTGNSVEFQ